VSRYRDQVAAALRAVAIRGDSRYAWLGRPSRPLPAPLYAILDASERRRYLERCLREELYASFYRHGRPVPARWGESQPMSADPWLVSAMSRSNSGRFCWETGWTVERVEDGEVVVLSSRLRARVPAGDCRALAGAVGPGAAVSVRVPTEFPAMAPGFYTVVGEAPVEHPRPRGDVRVYWNVRREGATLLVRALTSRLNAAGEPFRLKVADHASRLARCDAAVLYLSADAFPALRNTLRHVAAEVEARLQPHVPAFTLELAPGVGLSENDPEAESFGSRRCALLAEGIVRAHEQGIVRDSARVDAVAARFVEAGVLIDAPYLDPSLAGRHVL
jgi:HopA1 effector protein family